LCRNKIENDALIALWMGECAVELYPSLHPLLGRGRNSAERIIQIRLLVGS